MKRNLHHANDDMKIIIKSNFHISSTKTLKCLHSPEFWDVRRNETTPTNVESPKKQNWVKFAFSILGRV